MVKNPSSDWCMNSTGTTNNANRQAASSNISGGYSIPATASMPTLTAARLGTQNTSSEMIAAATEAKARKITPGAQPAPSVPEGFSREDLESVADGLDGYEKTVNVGNVTGEGDDHLESTTAYAARFIRAMLAAAPEAKP